MFRNYRTTGEIVLDVFGLALGILYVAFRVWGIQGLVISALIVLAVFLIIRFGVWEPLQNHQTRLRDEESRRDALRAAQLYLEPYVDIWRNLRLTNTHCTLSLASDGVVIRCEEKVEPYRRFRILSSDVHRYVDLWDLFCLSFTRSTTYDSLVNDCNIYKAKILETNSKKYSQKIKKNNITESKNLPKIDINNSSEMELTSLPGISIVMAKKAVKKREEIGGFKTVDDFILYLRIKPHIESQIRERVTVSKMKGSVKIERNTERRVDI